VHNNRKIRIQILDARIEIVTSSETVAELVTRLYPADSGWWQCCSSSVGSIAVEALNNRTTDIDVECYAVRVRSRDWVQDCTVAGFAALASRLDLSMNRLMVYALARNGHYLFHSGAVAQDCRSLLLPGKTGAGKSTLTAALVLSGYYYLSDEVVVIDHMGLQAWPFPKSISIRHSSWTALDHQFPGWRDPAMQNECVNSAEGLLVSPRRWLPPSPLNGRSVTHIVFPRYRHELVESRLIPLRRSDALIRLLCQRLAPTRAPSLSAYTRAAMQLIKAAKCYVLEVGTLFSAVACIDSLLRGVRSGVPQHQSLPEDTAGRLAAYPEYGATI
jgi:hypothetical protein